ncbi:MAG: hypothetical protein ACKOEO_22735 [Planctomycetaceae bacterium]
MVQPAWPEDTIRSLQLSEFDERFRRYRLAPPEADCKGCHVQPESRWSLSAGN